MRTLTHSIFVGLVGALMSCSGERGEQGAPGATGLDGKQGDPGAAGKPALTNVKDAPADKCPDGGKVIEAGVDKDGNGTLDASEVTSTSYVCNGAGGKSSLVKLSPESPGPNCPMGGTKIETGLDKNANGTLDADEVVAASTAYACNVAPSGSVADSEGINVAIKSGGVTTTAAGAIQLRFTLKDNRGYPIDVNGVYSKNTLIQPRFALAYFTKDATTGAVSPLKVLTKAGSTSAPATILPTALNPLGSAAGHGRLTENGSGAGDYTYEFPSADTAGGPSRVAYDATKASETHVAWVQVSRQTDLVYPTNANTFATANQDFYYVPSGAGTPSKREIVTTANCNKCHDGFKPETTASSAFHGGGRVNALFCNVCHNPDRTTNPDADSSVFVHRIHNGAKLPTASLFHGISASYPQDIRNCGACHKGAAQEAQATNTINRKVCTSCHANVKFDDSAATKCTDPPTLGADGRRVECNHQLGVMTDDSTCSSCHGAGKSFSVAVKHQPVVPPDPTSLYAGGTNANTNAAYLAATGYVPTGAKAPTYDVKIVEAWTDGGGVKRPRITFKMKLDGVDAPFQTYAAGSATELWPNFVGSPSAYFAWAVPQDGIAAPVDFNATASAYVKTIWNGTATGAGAGTLTGPDASGYYVLTMTGVAIPASAVMVTGGVGYSYSLTSTQPLTQTNVPGYAYNATTKIGGLIVPAPNVWRTATGYTTRRAIVDTAKCNNCHGALGAAPTFHAGQRNDGPTCSFCHNPNRTSSGWAADSKYFVHAIHAGRKRVNPFVWHATAPGVGYGEVEFPSPLNRCADCHVANTYDFTSPSNLASLPNQLFATVATGTYASTSPTYYTFSPYVTTGTAYGSGFSFSAATGVTTPADPTTLVISPITTACAACHDSTTAINHMKANGGHFYEPRSTALTGTPEGCLMCHGPGRVAAIGNAHQK